MNRMIRSVIILAIMLVSAVAAVRLTPKSLTESPPASLAQVVPRHLQGWVEDRADMAPVLSEGERATYDEVLMRTYRRTDGERVMLAIAYGRAQSQELKIHRPELCYTAQGFQVRPLGTRSVQLSADRSVDSVALLTRNRSRIEVVTYWIRIGGEITGSAWQTRWQILRTGLAGSLPDGLMMRTSSLVASESQASAALALQHEFLSELYQQVQPTTQRLLAGG